MKKLSLKMIALMATMMMSLTTQAKTQYVGGRVIDQFYPELMDELKRTLKAMEIDYYKPAVKCVRNRILNGKLK